MPLAPVSSGSATTIHQILGDNIRVHRALRRLDQHGLAHAMNEHGHNWKRATVSQTERCRRNVTVSELLALALALRTTVAELLDPRPSGHVTPIVLADQGVELTPEQLTGLMGFW